MKLVVQRVSSAAVAVSDKIVGSINEGFLVLLGIGKGDTKEMVEKMVDKLQKLRIFPDKDGKTNLSISDVGGELLIVSQFTLYADCRKGTRPSFTDAASPALAQELYQYCIDYAKGKFSKVEHGVFGASMKVELVNDGPFTIILES